jgi:hypothetical protein
MRWTAEDTRRGGGIEKASVIPHNDIFLFSALVAFVPIHACIFVVVFARSEERTSLAKTYPATSL